MIIILHYKSQFGVLMLFFLSQFPPPPPLNIHIHVCVCFKKCTFGQIMPVQHFFFFFFFFFLGGGSNYWPHGQKSIWSTGQCPNARLASLPLNPD